MSFSDKIPSHREFIIKEHEEKKSKDGKERDTEMRLRWDCFWASKISQDQWQEWKDYKDSHIDTALKAIMKEISA